jgi:hypothetical protein
MKRNLLVACSLILVCAAWVSPASADPGRGTTVLAFHCQRLARLTNQIILYSYNEQNRAKGISVTKTANGSYTVTCTGVGGGTAWGEGGHVQVTAVGSNSTLCKVVDWSTGAGLLGRREKLRIRQGLVECLAQRSHSIGWNI